MHSLKFKKLALVVYTVGLHWLPDGYTAKDYILIVIQDPNADQGS